MSCPGQAPERPSHREVSSLRAPRQPLVSSHLDPGLDVIGAEREGQLLIVADLNSSHARGTRTCARRLIDRHTVHANFNRAGSAAACDCVYSETGPGAEREFSWGAVGSAVQHDINP